MRKELQERVVAVITELGCINDELMTELVQNERHHEPKNVRTLAIEIGGVAASKAALETVV